MRWQIWLLALALPVQSSQTQVMKVTRANFSYRDRAILDPRIESLRDALPGRKG